MILKHGCATLRAIEQKDLELLWELFNDPAIERTTVGKNFPNSHDAQAAWAAAQRNTEKEIRLVVELENGQAIGMVTLGSIDWFDRTALLHYKASPSVTGRQKGDMADALTALLDYAFRELGLHRIEAGILDFNIRSLKLAHKMGFQDEGVMRQKVFKNNAYHDEIILGLLKEEWEEAAKNI